MHFEWVGWFIYDAGVGVVLTCKGNKGISFQQSCWVVSVSKGIACYLCSFFTNDRYIIFLRFVKKALYMLIRHSRCWVFPEQVRPQILWLESQPNKQSSCLFFWRPEILKKSRLFMNRISKVRQTTSNKDKQDTQQSDFSRLLSLTLVWNTCILVLLFVFILFNIYRVASWSI